MPPCVCTNCSWYLSFTPLVLQRSLTSELNLPPTLERRDGLRPKRDAWHEWTRRVPFRVLSSCDTTWWSLSQSICDGLLGFLVFPGPDDFVVVEAIGPASERRIIPWMWFMCILRLMLLEVWCSSIRDYPVQVVVRHPLTIFHFAASAWNGDKHDALRLASSVVRIFCPSKSVPRWDALAEWISWFFSCGVYVSRRQSVFFSEWPVWRRFFGIRRDWFPIGSQNRSRKYLFQ